MRIIGGHDYYDTALSFGHDIHTVFVRESNRCLTDNEVNCPNIGVRLTLTGGSQPYMRLGVTTDDFQTRDQRHTIGCVTVIFCGKIHRGMMIRTQRELRLSTSYFWHVEPFNEWLAEVGIAVGRRSDKVESLFATESVSTSLLDWLVTNKAVIAIRVAPSRYAAKDQPTWEINPCRLKELEFYRKLNAFEAFQEIDMWIGGVLPGKGSDMQMVDDQTLLAKHGFDKTSFRRRKQT